MNSNTPPFPPIRKENTYSPNQGQHNSQGSNQQQQVIMNEGIRSPQVRAISSTGEQLGILSTREALDLAYSESLDLVVISMQNPPVAKIMDYGKFKFEKEKEEKDKKKKSKLQSVFKELKISSRIDPHDLQVKIKWMSKWLEEGSKVRIVLPLKGRETQFPELARDVLRTVMDALTEVGKPDLSPPIRQEGRMFSLQLSPITPAGTKKV
ncbi:MAG: translation initiation factor IF-3 [Candidatus Melainabacteria bacterium]|jgi:translation initiation factor IF-3